MLQDAIWDSLGYKMYQNPVLHLYLFKKKKKVCCLASKIVPRAGVEARHRAAFQGCFCTM